MGFYALVTYFIQATLAKETASDVLGWQARLNPSLLGTCGQGKRLTQHLLGHEGIQQA